MSDEKRIDELVERVRRVYHVPPEPPREAMWQAIARGMRGPAASEAEVIDLAARRRRTVSWPLAWGAAAAALLVLGIGIGRLTAPGVEVLAPVAETGRAGAALQRAAGEHFARTESLLTMVRADARAGDLDPVTAGWARDLLTETRMLLDARAAQDPAATELLEDLELLLVQIVGVAEMDAPGSPRGREELALTLRGLEQGEMLPRIQAALAGA